MKLRVVTPLRFAVEADDVRYVRAEDATGSFGIQARHAPIVTVLELSIVTWRDARGAEHHVATRGGVLSANEGVVEIATHEAVVGDDLAQLERDVIARFREQEQLEQTARAGAARLETAAIRRMYEYIRGERPRFVAPTDESGDGQR